MGIGSSSPNVCGAAWVVRMVRGWRRGRGRGGEREVPVAGRLAPAAGVCTLGLRPCRLRASTKDSEERAPSLC